MADVRPPWRIPLLILGFASLIIGVGAGLLRLGWAVPRPAAHRGALLRPSRHAARAPPPRYPSPPPVAPPPPQPEASRPG